MATSEEGDSATADGCAPPALLRRVSNKRGLAVFVGVSGLLSRVEGEPSAHSQPVQLGACWTAASNFFGLGEWWSLAWGGAPLAALATELERTHGASIPVSTASGAEGVSGEASDLMSGALETAAALVQTLPLRGPMGACYDAAKAAGAALAQMIRRGGFGARPVSLLGVSLGARVVWQCLEILAALPKEEVSV